MLVLVCASECESQLICYYKKPQKHGTQLNLLQEHSDSAFSSADTSGVCLPNLNLANGAECLPRSSFWRNESSSDRTQDAVWASKVSVCSGVGEVKQRAKASRGAGSLFLSASSSPVPRSTLRFGHLSRPRSTLPLRLVPILPSAASSSFHPPSPSDPLPYDSSLVHSLRLNGCSSRSSQYAQHGTSTSSSSFYILLYTLALLVWLSERNLTYGSKVKMCSMIEPCKII